MKQRVLSGHVGPVYRCIFSQDGNYALSAGHDKTIRLWNPHRAAEDNENNASQVFCYQGVHGYEAVDVAVAADNSMFLSCGGDKCCFVFDVKTGRNTRKLFGHEHRINSVGLKREDATIAFTASYDATVRLWDLRQFSTKGACVQVLKDFADSVSCVTCCDEEIIATSLDGCVRIYDLRAGKMHQDSVALGDSESKSGGVSWGSVSNDDKCLLLSCLAEPAQICLIEKATGKKLQSYTGHQNTSYRLTNCFDNEDATVLSGGEDGCIYRWDLVTGKINQKFDKVHQRAVSSVAFHPKMNAFLSSSYDGTSVFHDLK